MWKSPFDKQPSHALSRGMRSFLTHFEALESQLYINTRVCSAVPCMSAH